MRQSDIARAIRAALSEGLTINRIEVENERVVLVTSTPEKHAAKAAESGIDEARIAAAMAAVKLKSRELIELGKKRRREEKISRAGKRTDLPKTK